MSYLDKSKKTATNICKITVCKTNKMAQRTKLKMHINECKNQIEDIYNEIGKKVYEKHVREENIDIKQELQDECNKIDKLAKDIDNAIEHILVLKDMKKCPECFSEIMLQYNFCPNCGTKQYDIKSRGDNAVENGVGVGVPDDPILDTTNEKEAEIIEEENNE